MADPISIIGAVGLGATIAGTGVKMFGEYEEGQSAQAMAAYKTQVLQERAHYETVVGEQRAQVSGMKTAARIGQITAAQGASGLDVNRGSAPIVRESQHEVGWMDQNTIRADAARRAYGLQEEAKLATYSGRYAKSAATLKMVGTALGGAASVSSKWIQGNELGLWDTSES